MEYLLSFFRQKVPEGGKNMPAYYRSAVVISEILLASYFLICEGLIFVSTKQPEFIPIAVCVLMALLAAFSQTISRRMHIGAYTLIIVVWCGWYIYNYGWGCGGQLLLLPLLTLNFFDIFTKPWVKLCNCIGLIAYRMVLYVWTLNNSPVFPLAPSANILFQTANCIILFILLSLEFIIFSSGLQKTERMLRLDNQALTKEADTDPLTQLPNRRALENIITTFRKNSPDSPFCVAIGDIDHFKNVNDTYGHQCGDHTLRTLADLFREKGREDFSVCRWGGEEFCFFLPEKNIDEAWNSMFSLCDSVRKMPLQFEENSFTITITIGIAENDFRSPIEKILQDADKKLYLGKVSGRDRVVM